MKDPIVEEVRRVRKAHAKKHGYDLKSICKELKQKEKEYNHRLVLLPPRLIMKATGS